MSQFNHSTLKDQKVLFRSHHQCFPYNRRATESHSPSCGSSLDSLPEGTPTQVPLKIYRGSLVDTNSAVSYDRRVLGSGHFHTRLLRSVLHWCPVCDGVGGTRFPDTAWLLTGRERVKVKLRECVFLSVNREGRWRSTVNVLIFSLSPFFRPSMDTLRTPSGLYV